MASGSERGVAAALETVSVRAARTTALEWIKILRIPRTTGRTSSPQDASSIPTLGCDQPHEVARTLAFFKCSADETQGSSRRRNRSIVVGKPQPPALSLT